MIYVDTSVVLAQVFAENGLPPSSLWVEDLVSSRLMEYEAWVRVHAYGKAGTHGASLVSTLACIDLIALDEQACARSRAAFPVAVRTLDALHLSSADHLRTRGFVVEIASYDQRMREAATAMGFPLFPL